MAPRGLARPCTRHHHADRRRAGIAVVVCGWHVSASQHRGLSAYRFRTVAPAHRPRAADQRRYARRGNRVSQRALHARCQLLARRHLGQGRGPLSHRRWALRAFAHQLPASSRRHAEAARLCVFARSGAARTRWLGRREVRDRRRRGRTGHHHDALACRMGRPSTRQGRCGAAAFHHREDRRRAAAALAFRRPPALRRACARPHAGDRRPGVRAYACGAWRGCDWR